MVDVFKSLDSLVIFSKRLYILASNTRTHTVFMIREKRRTLKPLVIIALKVKCIEST